MAAADAATIERQAQAHITAQERVRAITVAGVARAWDDLPAYDEAQVPVFLAGVVPVVLAAQRRSVALTNAFLARAAGRPPLALDITQLIGSAIRTATPAVVEASRSNAGPTLPEDATGVPLELVYRRAFVQTWSALADHTPWADAVTQGRDRATATAAIDVQNAMRHTLVAIGEADDTILGYRRVPDAGACPFCRLIAGVRYLTSQLQPVHPFCGCGVAPIFQATRGDFTGNAHNDLDVTRDGVSAAVREHGELGALLVDGSHAFTGPNDLP